MILCFLILDDNYYANQLKILCRLGFTDPIPIDILLRS